MDEDEGVEFRGVPVRASHPITIPPRFRASAAATQSAGEPVAEYSSASGSKFSTFDEAVEHNYVTTLNRWASECAKNAECHNAQAKKYKRRMLYYTVSTVGLAGLSSLITAIGQIFDPYGTATPISVIAITGFLGVMRAVEALLDPHVKFSQHTWSSGEYAVLSREISSVVLSQKSEPLYTTWGTCLRAMRTRLQHLDDTTEPL